MMRRRDFLVTGSLGLLAAATGCYGLDDGSYKFRSPITGDRIEVLRAYLESQYGYEPARNLMAFAVFRDNQWVFPGDGEEVSNEWEFTINAGEDVWVWSVETN